MENELLEKLSKSLELKNESKEKELDFDSFFSDENTLNDLNTKKQEQNLNDEKQNSNTQNQEQNTNPKTPTAYDIYHAKTYGYFDELYPQISSANNADNLNLKLKKLSGEKEYQELQSINKALGNLNDIVSLSNETSGTINALDRWLGETTNNFFTPSEENIQRANSNSSLYANYLASVSLRSGGTAKERARIAEAINFGAMNAKDTRAKALKVADDLLKRQNIALQTLKAKGYDENVLFSQGNDVNDYLKNLKAYEYLKNNQDNFKDKHFDSILKYGDYFEKDKELRRVKKD